MEAAPPRFVMALIRFGLGVVRPFLPARYMAALEHAGLFIFMGVMNNIASYIIYVLLLNLLPLTRSEALVGAYGLGMFVAYYNFSRFVFSSQVRYVGLRFGLAYIALYLINLGMLEALVWASSLSDELAQFLLIAPVAGFSYLINRYIVFR